MMLQKLYSAAKVVADSLEGDYIGKTEFKRALLEAETFLASKEAPSKKNNVYSGSLFELPKSKQEKPILIKKLIDTLRPFAPHRSTLPILSCIHVTDGSTIWATDLDMICSISREKLFGGFSFSVSLEQWSLLSDLTLSTTKWTIRSKFGGTIAVPLPEDAPSYQTSERHHIGCTYDTEQAFRDYAKERFDSTDVVINRQDEVIVSGDNREFVLTGFDPEDAPKSNLHYAQDLPLIYESKTTLDVLSSVVRVGQCCATDLSRPILTTVKMSVDEDTMTLVACDSFVLLVDKMTVNMEPLEVLIPVNFANSALKVFKKWSVNELTLKVFQNDTRYRILIEGFTFDDLKISVSGEGIEGKYPDYNQIIPKVVDGATITGDKTKFVEFCDKLINISKNTSDDYVALTLADNKIVAKSKDNTITNDTLRIEGPEVEIGVNSVLFKRVISNMTGKTIKVEVPSNSAYAIKLSDEGHCVGVVMPMHIKN